MPLDKNTAWIIFSIRNKETTWMPSLPGIQKHKLCLALKITFKLNKKGVGWGGVGEGGCHAIDIFPSGVSPATKPFRISV